VVASIFVHEVRSGFRARRRASVMYLHLIDALSPAFAGWAKVVLLNPGVPLRFTPGLCLRPHSRAGDSLLSVLGLTPAGFMLSPAFAG
jgi:hypothetical protein